MKKSVLFFKKHTQSQQYELAKNDPRKTFKTGEWALDIQKQGLPVG